MDGAMNLNPDFREFVGLLLSHNVRFLVIGGYAVAAHGHPRYTKDLDIWVWADPTNSERILAALRDFGFGDVGLTSSDFQKPGAIIQLGSEPQRIDILTSATGLDFADAYEHRIHVSIDGVDVPFISLDDLKKNKSSTGRLQDLADVEALERD